MKVILIALAGLAGSACAAPTASTTAPSPLAAPARVGAADTAVDRGQVRSGACVVERALDGRAVCAAATPAPASAAAAPAPLPATVAVESLTPGRYLVIGSFAERVNAERWARFNAEFGTEIQAVTGTDEPMYRVLVGPLASDDTGLLREILAAVGIGRGWRLAVCADGLPAAGAACDGLGGAAELADAGAP